MALPDENDRTDEATVALPVEKNPKERTTAAEPDENHPTDEATVALPVENPSMEPATAAVPSEHQPPDEATVALQVENQPPDEATVVLPGGNDSTDPATVALPDGNDSTGQATMAPPADNDPTDPAAEALPDTHDPTDEATGAQPGDNDPTDPTTATPPAANDPTAPATMARPDAVDEPTEALPAKDDRKDEATAVLPAGADEATVAVPPPPPISTDSTPAPLPGRRSFSRRRLLLLGAGLTAGAVVGGIAVANAGGEPDSPVATGEPTPRATTTPREPESTHAAPPPVAVQRAPIFTLAEYRKATGAAPLPSDAIALTIDDGPHPVWTPKILRLLDRHHVPAMFCMIGNQVLGHEDVATMVTAAGHQLANHTWSHPTSLEKKTGDAVHREILRAQKKIQKTTGKTPRFFRSPGGAWSPTVLQQTAAAGLLPLDWTNDPKDWARPGVAKIEHTMLAARPGQILLCHDGGGDRSQTYFALKAVLPQLKARGLRFVAL